ncbi:nitroreductase [Falsigemmobacter faecalis]|uniref:Nitroreductase n=1 Tax=Falsigemmobacter faecalis TaxID=2488730 RepID=A0A3P3DH25_9RHOB|nr:nitroreductase [Falsigemmobacter faecalis]RRH73551.1 nitroreductase [Falsigemmobacter faecalis]
MTSTENPVLEAIRSRRSVRAYLPKEVPGETIREILAAAARTPSGSNIQPWHVAVVTGAPLKALGEELSAKYLAGEVEGREYDYYPRTWREPYLARRRATGWGLYSALGIAKGETARMAAQHARNFRFFDAPAGIFFLLERDMEIGSWLDLGMFIQNIMIAARGFGLHSCPQAAFADFPRLIPQRLGLADNLQLICGMALGYEDPSAPENAFTPERMAPEEFVTYIG